MQFVNNEPEQIEIRKSQNTLIVVGTGTVLFSIWSVIKMAGMLILLRKETLDALLEKLGPFEGLSDNVVFWLFFLMTVFFMTLILGIRVFVGMSAVAEGRGKRRGLLYILIAVVMIIFNIVGFCSGFFTTEAPAQFGALTRNQSISTLIIDVTSMIMLIHMVISALKIRKLTGAERTAKD